MSKEQSRFTFTTYSMGCVPYVSAGRPVVVPSLPLSPIVPDIADDSVTAIMGSSRDESIFPEVGVMVPPLVDVSLGLTVDVLRVVSPLPSVEGLLQDMLWPPVAPRSPDVADRRASCSANQVPPWRLAREGPFLAERSPDTRSFGAGCAFRNTTYRASDYTASSGEFGLPMHHTRFLEWLALPKSASLLEMVSRTVVGRSFTESGYGGGRPVAAGRLCDVWTSIRSRCRRRHRN